MKYNYNNNSDEFDKEVEISQRQRPNFPDDMPEDFRDRPQRPREDRPGQQRPEFPGRPGQEFPGGFPGGFPEDFQGGPPVGLPPGLRVRPPQGPPPSIVPEMPRQDIQRSFRTDQPGFGYPEDFILIDPRGIRRCLYRFTFIWLRNGNSFWFYPIYVAGGTVIGFRWRARGWDYYSLNLRRIFYFRCF